LRSSVRGGEVGGAGHRSGGSKGWNGTEARDGCGRWTRNHCKRLDDRLLSSHSRTNGTVYDRTLQHKAERRESDAKCMSAVECRERGECCNARAVRPPYLAAQGREKWPLAARAVRVRRSRLSLRHAKEQGSMCMRIEKGSKGKLNKGKLNTSTGRTVASSPP